MIIFLLCDETTNYTVTEQLAVHGCYISNTEEWKRYYLKIVDLLQCDSNTQFGAEAGSCISSNVQTITDRVCKFMAEAKLKKSKLRDIGTEYASTTIACNNRIATHLKSLEPSAISVYCAANRLNLASSQASNSVPYVKNFITSFVSFFIFQ